MERCKKLYKGRDDLAKPILHWIIYATSQRLHLKARNERAEEQETESSPAPSGSPERSTSSAGTARNVTLSL